VNRLAARVSLAMVAVVVVAIGLTVAAQFALLRQQFEALPEAVRSDLEAIVRAPGPPGPGEVARIEAVFLTWLEDPAAREAVVGSLLATRQPAAQVGFVAAALLAAAIAAAVGVVVAGRIARPVGAVARAARRMADGDLTARAAPPPSGRHRSRRRAPDEVVGLAADFDQMAATLERLERERTRLIADVAHELRTPLAVLQGRLEGMLDGVLPSTPAELARLHRQTAHLTRLVEDLRVLSLADADRLTLQREDVDLVAWARDVAAGFAHAAAARGVGLEVVAEADAIVVPVDRKRLTQVLSNLLDNAVGVSPAGGRVEVRLGFTASGARVAVLDEGPGLSPDAAERLFERFYRARGDGADRAGSGLGLAIVRSLVEAHGGRVAAANRANGGARVEVSLPAPLENVARRS